MKKSLFFAMVILFTACKNSDTRPTISTILQGDYQTITTAELEQPVMFTSSEKITDQARIKEYISRRKTNVFNFTSGTETSNLPVISIAFKAEKKVSIRQQQNNGIAAIYQFNGNIYRQDDADIYIKKPIPDTLSYATGTIIFGGSGGSITLGKIDTRMTCVQAGYHGTICTYTPSLVLNIKKGSLYVPLLTYDVYQRREFSMSTYTATNQPVSLNPDIISELTSGDTVVVQQKYLKLEKK
ncbi:hypothetical protein GCM10023149_49140 [Mucilaginibacter gynuensis]|uniref:Lipoprotein n=1 Tax=Mucilaginibacter gynuensis TaxID=1302236 RepID=A0ABP8HFY5_9SPHI